MASAVKTLSFASRWTNIALWHVVSLHATAGAFRAEYVSGSERMIGSAWAYDFLIYSGDLPSPLTLADVVNGLLVAPFVTAFAPCDPAITTCFESVPALGVGEQYQLMVVVGPNDCGQWCMKRTNAPDQYTHGGTWDDHPGQPDPI